MAGFWKAGHFYNTRQRGAVGTEQMVTLISKIGFPFSELNRSQTRYCFAVHSGIAGSIERIEKAGGWDKTSFR
ncbi:MULTISPECIES: hypothetical protein [Cytobacillus]|uniref:hypothetical protein n=1 Tax=Cytobacillus TaxID=2675230 RepID=UPI0020405FA5|nr:hypothetical protein [Cytobacillus firmus]MCM3708379.1 hypothetical protein [Cytobacillus firmus]